MGNELVEKVARSLAREAYSTGGMERITDPYTPDADYWNGQARAALRVALEEAAKVCEARYMGDNNREDMEARRCAAAIRALIPEDK